jgi:hypothetical protein
MKRTALIFPLLLLMLVSVALAGCGSSESTAPPGPTTPPETSAQQTPTTEEQSTTTELSYSSWVVYINDDDSYTEGDVTYSIALNLTATNPTQDIAGTYTGSATASTTVEGEVNGEPLNASAIVKSTKLEFALEEGFDSAGGALAPLTPDEAVYSGSGTIVMEAEGSGNIGQAGGAFSNTSGQTINISVEGAAATLTVDIEGHTYTFEGTISAQ